MTQMHCDVAVFSKCMNHRAIWDRKQAQAKIIADLDLCELTEDRAMRANRWTVFLVLLMPVLFLLAEAVLSAQDINLGGIAGTVTDASGAVVSGAHILATNSETAAKNEAVTGESG